jgi:hypothetical protein
VVSIDGRPLAGVASARALAALTQGAPGSAARLVVRRRGATEDEAMLLVRPEGGSA